MRWAGQVASMGEWKILRKPDAKRTLGRLVVKMWSLFDSISVGSGGVLL
jgi:hypothetical protein